MNADLRCCLCGFDSGALKRTTFGEWCHLTCSQWIPEVFHRLSNGNHSIDCTFIPKYKYKLKCDYCNNQYYGETVCTECSEPSCKSAFHITCALKNYCKFYYKVNANGADSVVSYCDKHSTKSRRKINTNRKS